MIFYKSNRLDEMAESFKWKSFKRTLNLALSWNSNRVTLNIVDRIN